MLEIAKILKPQGIKGEVKALPLTNVLAVFKSLKNVFVQSKEMTIEKISMRQGFLYIKFSEINSRNDAELLRNLKLYVSKDYLQNFKQEDEFFIDDLIGMVIYDENNILVGQIVDVINYDILTRMLVPQNMSRPITALCNLLICRNAWWQKLGWKPDWKKHDDKYVVRINGDNIISSVFLNDNFILAFPTEEVRDKFAETFKDLIEEAKELL